MAVKSMVTPNSKHIKQGCRYSQSKEQGDSLVTSWCKCIGKAELIKMHGLLANVNEHQRNLQEHDRCS